MKTSALTLFAFAAVAVRAQQAEWAQCGGIGWSGGTTCASGNVCTELNAYYYQCLPGTATTTTTSSHTTTSTTSHSTSTTSTSHSTSTSSSHSSTSTSSTHTTTTSTSTSSSASASSTGTGTDSGGYVQITSGSASFTYYSGCQQPACGITASGYTAAIDQLSFGAPPGVGPGDACGRCFSLTGEADPYDPSFTGPFNTIIVRITDECPVAGNSVWCGMTKEDDSNTYGAQVHFDLCEDTGANTVFFPSGHGALTGTFEEVPCSEWSGSSNGTPLWNGACLAPVNTPLWPSVACGNQGTAP